LSVLVFGGPRTLGALAGVEHVRPPTMTRIVAALEGQGLVRRAPVPEDRRAAMLRATPRGVRLMHAGRKRRVAVVVQGLARLNDGERATLERAAGLLARMAAMV
jgi:DNA-binding MarR family transcriptional regulator